MTHRVYCDTASRVLVQTTLATARTKRTFERRQQQSPMCTILDETEAREVLLCKKYKKPIFMVLLTKLMYLKPNCNSNSNCKDAILTLQVGNLEQSNFLKDIPTLQNCIGFNSGNDI